MPDEPVGWQGFGWIGFAEQQMGGEHRFGRGERKRKFSPGCFKCHLTCADELVIMVRPSRSLC